MRSPEYTTQFKRDLKTAQKRGYDIDKLKALIIQLCDGAPLAPKHRDHALAGNWRGRRECHITPDWLLVYKLGKDVIVFERTGTHNDIFSL